MRKYDEKISILSFCVRKVANIFLFETYYDLCNENVIPELKEKTE